MNLKIGVCVVIVVGYFVSSLILIHWEQEPTITPRKQEQQQRTAYEVTAPNRVQLDAPTPAIPAEWIKGSLLPPSVQSFLQQAGSMTEEQVATREYPTSTMADFSQQVVKLASELHEAKEAYEVEIENSKAAATRAGQVREFPDESSYRAELAKKVPSGYLAIPIEGEEESPDGSPHRYYKLTVVSLNEHPALRHTLAYLDGFEEWRSVLRARAACLLALSRLPQQPK